MKRTTACLVIALVVVQARSGVRVAVDQLGYLPLARKVAILTVPADSVEVVDAVTRMGVYRQGVSLMSSGDAASGLALYSADFSPYSTGGRYFVRTTAGDTSAHFTIADTVYQPLYRASLRGFFFQRCGMLLPQSSAGVWSHSACHLSTDGNFHATAESTGHATVTGGWHDAGDYGKYSVNTGVTVGTLLMAYEFFPTQFMSDELQIPESGNGVPDILDEVRYGLEWMLRMQAAGGGVFFKVTKTSFEAFVMPQSDSGTRYIYQISSTATGDFAAVMARAARVYEAFDTTFASRCLAAARNAWSYLQAHPSIVPPGGFKNPSGTVTGEYGDASDSDERLWAAAELFLATGDSTAHTYYLNNFAAQGIINGTMWWGDVRTLAQLAYLRGNAPGMNATAKQSIRQALFARCGIIAALRDNSGFRNALGVNEYYWGSNSTVLNNAMLLILGAEEGGVEEWREAALDQLHYILGANAHMMTFVTGIGTRSPLHPHHRPSEADGIAAPVPGLVVGGPNQSIGDDPVLSARFSTSTPHALCYVDTMPSYGSNEIAINWNAPLVFVAGYFARGSSNTSVPPAENLPGEIGLEQNWPNPFNPVTSIGYSVGGLGSRQQAIGSRVVRLAVYDLLGREVAVLVNEEKLPGEYAATWDAKGMASGVYFYRVAAGGVCQTKRMLLLR